MLARMLTLLVLFIGPALGRSEPPTTPASSVRLALADARTLGPRAVEARYLSVYHIAPGERPDYYRAISFLVLSLSRERTIIRPALVPGSEDTLIRVLLTDYAIDAKGWDRLAAEGSGPAASRQPEPYFQTKLVHLVDTYESKQVFAGYDQYGRPQYRVQQTKNGTKRETTLAAAPWLPAGEIAQLIAITQSQAPILRGDWFLAFASWAPAYYQLLGLGEKLADFERLAFADEVLAAKARAQVKGAVAFSSVALHNRTLNRIPTISGVLGGYFWLSKDTKASIDDRDYLNVLLDEKFDATEGICSLPNGLQAYLLTDGAGKRLDVALADIAIDGETGLADKQVYAARNCVTCHARGIRPIQDEVRALSRDQIALLVTDPTQARRVADLYFSIDLAAVVEHDNAQFAQAVRLANGLTPAANGALFERLVATYLDAPVTPERAAAEVGVSVEEFRARLSRAVSIDHSLTAFLSAPPRPTRRDQFERAFAQLMTVTAERGGQR